MTTFADSWLAASLLSLYYGILVVLSLYGVHRMVLVVAFLRHRRLAGRVAVCGPVDSAAAGAERVPDPPLRNALPAGWSEESLPVVTVQLPLFNEMYVARRLIDAVCALDLPNGLISLRSILSECLTESGHRGSTTLDVDSLPSRARTGRPPRAGELARGEYDAIVAALAECDGVRSRAAKRLGISRTTLYARMREFGLS